ncbi:alpha hydrolase-20 [Coleophoma cylindrospora]|uniref:1-alkyl-2-acetylglycerophosphocholine esterase n=1 Tax=Coleophoma cylindrospora TaxID=1849047 RepID=A0A3D8QSB0_9HELO|nr:alpha hydrolase-20 [Coleophoma cylindrospora]
MLSPTASFAGLLVLASILNTVKSASFPAPSGPYNTTLSIVQLVDKHRRDPFSPNGTARTIMISVFNPLSPELCTPLTVPYMDTLTAAYQDTKFSDYGIPAGTFESLELQVCQPNPAKATCPKSSSEKEPKHPLILFSPALGTTRLFYSAMAQQVASAGYIVVTIDHPYDVDIVTFPDNTTILETNITTDNDVLLALDTRVKDITFVLNQLSLPSVSKHLAPNIDISKVGIFGHSLGGAAAGEATLSDHRLQSGINLDGSFFGAITEQGLSKPFLLFAHEGKNTTTDPSWAAVWSRLRGWKRELMLAESAHYTFSDLPDVVQVLGIAGALPDEVAGLLGTINGGRALVVVTAYVEAFFDYFLRGDGNALLNGSSAAFPEVTFVAA